MARALNRIELVAETMRHALDSLAVAAPAWLQAQAPQARAERYASPMASRTLTDENFEIMQRLEQVASDAGHSLLELAMSWLAQQPAVASVISSATKPEQVEQNIAAAQWQVPAEVLAAVDAVTQRS